MSKKGTQIKDTVQGVADAIIEFEHIDDIQSQLKALVERRA